MRYVGLLFLFLVGPLYSAESEIEEQGMSSYYEEVLLGEKPAPLYSGPISPDGKFDPLTGQFTFLDDLHQERYIERFLNQELFNLAENWFHEFPLSSACPNFYLNQNVDYIRYLFRLITMSYVFEGMKATNIALHQLGFDRNACSISWHQTFSKCRPQDKEMDKFVKRVQYRFLDDLDRSSYVRLSESEKKQWLKNLQNNIKNNSSNDIARARVLGWCQQEGRDCENISEKEVREALEGSCQRDRELIQSACSNSDQLYGLSYVDDLVELISKSNALAVIDSGGHGKSCLKRFVKIFERKETKESHFSSLFPVIRKKLEDKKSRYLQGSLFLPGALKEFDDRGLDDFLFKKPEPEPVVVVEVPKKPEPKKLPPPVEKPKPAPKKKPAPKPVPTPPKVEEKKLSTFQLAQEELEKSGQKRVALDMQKFKKDFVFSPEMVKALEEPLKDYQTRVALSDMKRFDLVGSRDEPVRLIFLKFLIDNNMHQGLFNMTAVLGDQFYIVNDIDGESEAVAIELENSKSTNYRWTITLLREDQVIK